MTRTTGEVSLAEHLCSAGQRTWTNQVEKAIQIDWLGLYDGRHHTGRVLRLQANQAVFEFNATSIKVFGSKWFNHCPYSGKYISSSS